MKFNKLVKEVKGDLAVGDQITIPGNTNVWTIDSEDDQYFEIKNNTTGEKTSISKFKLGDIKKFPILEYKTAEEKDAEVERYRKQISELKIKMAGFKANSRGGAEYKKLEHHLERLKTAMDVAQRSTPYMNIY